MTEPEDPVDEVEETKEPTSTGSIRILALTGLAKLAAKKMRDDFFDMVREDPNFLDDEMTAFVLQTTASIMGSVERIKTAMGNRDLPVTKNDCGEQDQHPVTEGDLGEQDQDDMLDEAAYTTEEAEAVFRFFRDHLDQPATKRQICREINRFPSEDIGFLLSAVRKAANQQGLALSYFDGKTRTWTMTEKNADVILKGVLTRALDILTYLEGIHMQCQWLEHMSTDELDRETVGFIADWSR